MNNSMFSTTSFEEDSSSATATRHVIISWPIVMKKQWTAGAHKTW